MICLGEAGEETDNEFLRLAEYKVVVSFHCLCFLRDELDPSPDSGDDRHSSHSPELTNLWPAAGLHMCRSRLN